MLSLALCALCGCDKSAVSSTDAALDQRAPADAAPREDSQSDDPCARAASEQDDARAYEAVIACAAEPSRSEREAREAIDAFVRGVEGRGGFPIAGGGRTRFVYVRDARWDSEDDASSRAEDFAMERRAEPLAVVGDFNAWTDGALAMRHVGRGLFVAELDREPASERWGYKLVARDGASAPVLFSDPLSRRFQYDDNGRISLVRGGPTAGHLEWIRSVHASALDNDRAIYLYAPPGYDQREAERFPTLYLQDGNNAFDTAQPRSAPSSWDVDQTADAEINAGRARPFGIVAIPNNDDRMSEYTHTRDTIDGTVLGGRGDAYVSFLTEDLKPVIDRRYRTQPGRESTAILGSSLGGLIAFHAGLRAPTVFAMIGGMSSTFEWGGFGGGSDTMLARYSAAMNLRTQNQRWYLDSGGGPGADGSCAFDGVDDPRDNYCETDAMKQTLVRAGISTFPRDPDALRIEPADCNIYHWYERDAPHNEAAWRARFFRVVRFFFRPT